MKKHILFITFLMTALTSCAGNTPSKNVIKPKKDPITQEIGSALDSDKGKRLDYLTKSITEKRAQLLKAKNVVQQNQTEETELEVEILDNEILLLEAEMFGLQEGMELNPTEL